MKWWHWVLLLGGALVVWLFVIPALRSRAVPRVAVGKTPKDIASFLTIGGRPPGERRGPRENAAPWIKQLFGQGGAPPPTPPPAGGANSTRADFESDFKRHISSRPGSLRTSSTTAREPVSSFDAELGALRTKTETTAPTTTTTTAIPKGTTPLGGLRA